MQGPWKKEIKLKSNVVYVARTWPLTKLGLIKILNMPHQRCGPPKPMAEMKYFEIMIHELIGGVQERKVHCPPFT
jgi:hypothetical protein